jgi:hypothetical protein
VVKQTKLLIGIVRQTVRLYDVNANEQKAKFDQRAAVLSCCFQDASHGFSGGLDTYIRGYVSNHNGACFADMIKQVRTRDGTDVSSR